MAPFIALVDFALEPGGTTTLTIVDATDDTVVVVAYDGEPVETIAWQEPEGCDDPATEDPSTEDPSTEDPSTEDPSTEDPSTEDPSTEDPSTGEPATEEPATGGEGGGAADLPATGSPTLWMAGVAVALLAAGSARYLLARRRRSASVTSWLRPSARPDRDGAAAVRLAAPSLFQWGHVDGGT